MTTSLTLRAGDGQRRNETQDEYKHRLEKEKRKRAAKESRRRAEAERRKREAEVKKKHDAASARHANGELLHHVVSKIAIATLKSSAI